MELYLIRHSEPDYSYIKEDDNCVYPNFAPLSTRGVNKALKGKNALSQYVENANVILSSPITRALQTANLVVGEPNDIIIEPNLHEWLPSKNFNIKVRDIPQRNIDYKKNVENVDYENDEEMLQRFYNVLYKYRYYKRIMIFAHSRLIRTFLKSRNIDVKYMDYCECITIQVEIDEIVKYNGGIVKINDTTKGYIG